MLQALRPLPPGFPQHPLLMLRNILTLSLLTGLAAPLAAQDLFRANLSGAEEIPPLATTAGGWSTVVLNANSTLTYTLRTWGLNGIDAHIHVGAPGTSGGILITLVGGPAVWAGTSTALTPANVATLRAGGLYMNVHTAAHQAGEIRGQILASPANFAANANGAQETPPSGSSATAVGTFLVNPDRSVTYSVGATGLSATSAHIHTGDPGVAGAVLFTLTPGPTSWSGTTAPLSETDFALFQRGGMYLNIHTAALPTGEIRGQIFNSGESYGFGCAGGGVTDCRLSTVGTPMSGGSVQLRITGGAPGGSGFLGISLAPAAALFGSCQRLIGLPTAATLPVSLNGAGSATMTLMLPSLMSDASAYFQFGGFSGGTLTYTSDGWALRVEVL